MIYAANAYQSCNDMCCMIHPAVVFSPYDDNKGTTHDEHAEH